MTDTYPKPEHGWTCFHCGETLRSPGAARDHFGAEMGALTGCQIKAGAERGLLMQLRKAEEELIQYRHDDKAVVREMYRLQSRHSDALRDAEDAGYERGLRDGRAQYQK